ncbi:MerR family transcriptional regulator [Acetobacterium carbinolicum]|uniref:MerR family transcriptional regulator n=1 Tax=Acetobacterium carbinolicum TaxID=52690 RepID=UPI003BF5BE59
MRLEFENEKNKVADMEKLLDVSTDTIHSYEKHGLILPKKDKNSNYRYFDIWDINFLLDSKPYKTAEF